MQLNVMLLPSSSTTVRSTPLTAIESPGRTPSISSPHSTTSVPRSDCRTNPTSSMMPVNISALSRESRAGVDARGSGEHILYATPDDRVIEADEPAARDNGSLLDRPEARQPLDHLLRRVIA